jgi:hypothetical protein
MREMLRNNRESDPVLDAIRACLAKKPRDHGGLDGPTGRTMSQIGG